MSTSPARPPARGPPSPRPSCPSLFPGLGHAYAGAYARAPRPSPPLPFLVAGAAGRDRPPGRPASSSLGVRRPAAGPDRRCSSLNVVALVYRVVAAVDAWQVARFLNAVDASGGGRLGRARLPLSPLSLAGLLAVILVMAGGHLVGRPLRRRWPSTSSNCVFSDSGDPYVRPAGPEASPGASATPGRPPTPSRAPSRDGRRPEQPHRRARAVGHARPHPAALGRQGAAQRPARRQRPAPRRQRASTRTR